MRALIEAAIETNASTFATRVVASTGADLVAAVVSGVSALSGPLHGGAPGPVLDLLDLILVMTVNPGFGGQAFLSSQLPKIEAVRDRIEKSGREIMLEVDGGINRDTAKDAIAAGADVLVAGTAVFDKGGKGPTHYAGNIARLRG